MKVEYDASTDSMYFQFSIGSSEYSREVVANFIVDYAKEDSIVGLEILQASKISNPQQLAESLHAISSSQQI
jgi:uncharacterized protein YuzE